MDYQQWHVQVDYDFKLQGATDNHWEFCKVMARSETEALARGRQKLGGSHRGYMFAVLD